MKDLVVEDTQVKCDNCGASLDLSKSAKCSYCGSTKEIKENEITNFVYAYACSSCSRQSILNYDGRNSECFVCGKSLNATPLKIYPVQDVLPQQISDGDMSYNLKLWANKGFSTSFFWQIKIDESKYRLTFLPVNLDYNPDLRLNIHEFLPIDSKVTSYLGYNERKVGREVSKTAGGTGAKLMPVYMGAAEFRNKRYYYLVNGITGEVQGEKAISYVKEFIRKTFIGVLLFLGFFILMGIYFSIFNPK